MSCFLQTPEEQSFAWKRGPEQGLLIRAGQLPRSQHGSQFQWMDSPAVGWWLLKIGQALNGNNRLSVGVLGRQRQVIISEGACRSSAQQHP